MSVDGDLAHLAGAVGIFHEYTDMQGRVHAATPDTQRAFLRANGFSVDTAGDVAAALADWFHTEKHRYAALDNVLPSDAPAHIAIRGEVAWSVLCDGSEQVLAEGTASDAINLPALPMGIHQLVLTGDAGPQTCNLIVTVPRAPALADLAGQERAWGVVAALYGLSRDTSRGIGDFKDLACLGSALGQAGAAFLGINPVHALGWAAPDTLSPYSPTHRGFLNTTHIAPEAQMAVSQDPTASLLDYAAHILSHRDAMRRDYDAFTTASDTPEHARFRAFCDAGGAALRSFAAFEALSETHGPDWRHWPAHLQQGSDAAEREAADCAFHKWLQWRADAQLQDAQAMARQGGMALGLYLDLAVGARLGGAESWGQEAASATGVSLGAPADQLSPAGQNWQLTAHSPHKLKQGGYRAFRHILAQTLRHCGVLRIDHALGLNRSFWIPEDGSPGGYIRQPFQSLMAVIAMEAHRAGAVIVGEDLGLVPPGFRDTMADGGLYGYSVLQYEKDAHGVFLPQSSMRTQSLACFGTHDTPTLRGYWEGHDIDWWQKLDWIDGAEAERARSTRAYEKRQLLDISPEDNLPDLAPVDVRDRVHSRLAQTPAALVAVQLDDILTVREAQNLPGTVDTHPNWRQRAPATIEQIAASQDLAKTAQIMAQAGRSADPKPTQKENT